jgi:hypothetical protein
MLIVKYWCYRSLSVFDKSRHVQKFGGDDSDENSADRHVTQARTIESSKIRNPLFSRGVFKKLLPVTVTA